MAIRVTLAEQGKSADLIRRQEATIQLAGEQEASDLTFGRLKGEAI